MLLKLPVVFIFVSANIVFHIVAVLQCHIASSVPATFCKYGDRRLRRRRIGTYPASPASMAIVSSGTTPTRIKTREVAKARTPTGLRRLHAKRPAGPQPCNSATVHMVRPAYRRLLRLLHDDHKARNLQRLRWMRRLHPSHVPSLL